MLSGIRDLFTVTIPQVLNKCIQTFYLLSGCDGVELNVLKDILGEPANDEFAAELDTQAKTSGKMTVFGCFTFPINLDFRILVFHHSSGHKDCSSYMTCIKCMHYDSFSHVMCASKILLTLLQ